MKRICFFVIGIHCVILLAMGVWVPIKKQNKHPLQVRTTVYTPPPPPKALAPAPLSPQPAAKKAATPPKKPTPAKSAALKAPVKKSPAIDQKLVKQLQETLAKIDEKSPNVLLNKPLSTPKRVPILKIDQHTSADHDGKYAVELIECLQSTLDLPEKGEVKIELTLTPEGHFVKMNLLQSQSKRNATFLEQTLQTVHFPKFSGSLKKEKEHTFVLSFYTH